MSDLEKMYEIKWIDFIHANVEGLSNYGCTTSFCTKEASSCIGAFEVASEDLDQFPDRSINDSELLREDENDDFNLWIVRFKLTKDGKSFEGFNMATESILIKHDYIGFMIEYAQDKLFATGDPTCMLLIDNWTNIRCIKDLDSSNIDKRFAFLVPDFDIADFPFIAVCGAQNLGLLNVRDSSFQSLINEQ